MEVASGSGDKAGFFTQGRSWLKALPVKFNANMVGMARNIKKLGQEDPRRVVHSLKVGLALTLVSTFYYFRLFKNFDVDAIWAVMTVVLVFEFSVGATLGKGLNRGMATLLAGGLGIEANHLATHLAKRSGHIGEPILILFLVFLQATISTFLRFVPKIKARCDYGMLIFILTFSMITVSGFQEDHILELAHNRLSTVSIGAAACVIVAIVVFPVWAGEDLHNLIALNIENLGNSLEGFGVEYFIRTGCEDDKKFLKGYKSVLNSKNSEESLANFAAWEPGHGRFTFGHPWKLYLKVGTLARECAYRIEALNGYLNADIQASSEVSNIIQEACTKMSRESGKSLKELALAIKIMVQPSSADSHIENAKSAAKNIKSLLKSGIWEDIDPLKVIPGVTVASILIDVVTYTEKISESIYELASKAQFKSVEPTLSPKKLHSGQNQSVKSAQMVNCPDVGINVRESTLPSPPSENSSAPKASKQRMGVQM